MSSPRGGEDTLTLFGLEKGWSSDDWVASDDSVRGGKSKSYLEVCSGKDDEHETAHFYGTLDLSALGTAGFASQRTVDEVGQWDLSSYAGIRLDLAKGDKKRYTFNVKDDVLPRNPENGREQSTISWECDFELPPQTEPGDTEHKYVYIPWSSLTPTYRGKVQKDAEPLNRRSIKRFSIMNRSFFGAQEGDFSLYIKSITAESKAPPPSSSRLIPINDEKSDIRLDASGLEEASEGSSATDVRQGASVIRLGPLSIDLRYVIVGATLLWFVHRTLYTCN